MQIGQIVCSLRGNDKGKFLLVLSEDEKFVYLADGKRHKLSSPKKKNKKHVSSTTDSLKCEEILTDKAVRRALAVYRSNLL